MEKPKNCLPLVPSTHDSLDFMTSEPPSYEQAISGNTITNCTPVKNAPTPSAPELTSENIQTQKHVFPPPAERVQQSLDRQPIVITTEESIYSFGPNPIFVRCPACGAQGMTRVAHEASSTSYLIATILCLLGCWICVLLSLCTDNSDNNDCACATCDACCCMDMNHCCASCNKINNNDCACATCDACCCMDMNHYCSSCNKFLGTYSEN